MGGLFNYDRDMMEPPEEREELDPSEYVYIGCGQYRYAVSYTHLGSGSDCFSRVSLMAFIFFKSATIFSL